MWATCNNSSPSSSIWMSFARTLLIDKNEDNICIHCDAMFFKQKNVAILLEQIHRKERWMFSAKILFIKYDSFVCNEQLNVLPGFRLNAHAYVSKRLEMVVAYHLISLAWTYGKNRGKEWLDCGLLIIHYFPIHITNNDNLNQCLPVIGLDKSFVLLLQLNNVPIAIWLECFSWYMHEIGSNWRKWSELTRFNGEFSNEEENGRLKGKTVGVGPAGDIPIQRWFFAIHLQQFSINKICEIFNFFFGSLDDLQLPGSKDVRCVRLLSSLFGNQHSYGIFCIFMKPSMHSS